MTKIGLLTSVVVILMGTAGVTQAKSPIPEATDDFSVYGQVEDWTVYTNATTKSCLIERTDADGNAMQMGMTPDGSEVYIGVFTLTKMDIKSGQPIEIAVDGQIFEGKSHGIKSGKLQGDYSGGYVLTNNPDFLQAIENGKKLIAFPEKTGLFEVDLTGTKAAIEEAKKCNSTLKG